MQRHNLQLNPTYGKAENSHDENHLKNAQVYMNSLNQPKLLQNSDHRLGSFSVINVTRVPKIQSIHFRSEF